MYASKVQSPRGNLGSALCEAILEKERTATDRGKPRSRSATREPERGAKEVQDMMKHTVDFTNKRFKPNTRGNLIQDSFVTLEEFLIKLPKFISFDIEISMVWQTS
jgi:glycerophosphodiester phosphodiesterase